MTENEKHRERTAEAIRILLRGPQWRPGKQEQHLAKRKARRHLPEGATTSDYDQVIVTVLNAADSLVSHYPHGRKDYYAVSGKAHGALWLIIFGWDGIMETAFPPDDLADYLRIHAFGLLGRRKDITYE